MADGGKVVRIGGAGGFLGDSSIAAPQLLGGGALDYMILDYLTEGALGMLGRGLKANPKSGYARDFTDWVWKDNLAQFKRQGVKLITNAGGMNPQECRRHMEKIAAEAGFSFKIAVIDGDDARDRLEAYKAEGVSEMFTGAAFPDPATALSANAYLGGRPIAAALSAGADVVITGRVVDSALTLGALACEFGWSFEDWDRMSAGSLAGHVIECGAQATGALFTDWEEVGDWAHIGYPIIECRADGSFVVSKPAGTGGLVSPAAVAEQILYEVGDPQAYMLPDVVCDFSEVQVTSAGESRVLVTGAKRYPATGRYKVCRTHTDGLRTIVLMPVVGRDAPKKAARQCEAVLRRVDEMLRARNLSPFRAVSTETLGSEARYGAQVRAQSARGGGQGRRRARRPARLRDVHARMEFADDVDVGRLNRLVRRHAERGAGGAGLLLHSRPVRDPSQRQPGGKDLRRGRAAGGSDLRSGESDRAEGRRWRGRDLGPGHSAADRHRLGPLGRQGRRLQCRRDRPRSGLPALYPRGDERSGGQGLLRPRIRGRGLPCGGALRGPRLERAELPLPGRAGRRPVR